VIIPTFRQLVFGGASPGLAIIQNDSLVWFDSLDATAGDVTTVGSRYGSDPKTATISAPATPKAVDDVVTHDGVDDSLRFQISTLGGLPDYSFVYAGSSTLTGDFKTAMGDVGFQAPVGWAGRHTFIGVREGASLKLYIDGALVSSGVVVTDVVDAGSLTASIGGSVVAGPYQGDCTWTEAGIFGRALTLDEVGDIHSHCASRWSGKTQVLIEGNSLTHNSVHGEEGWVSQMKKLGLPGLRVTNHAAGGATTTQLVDRFVAETAGICTTGQVSVVWEGGNDMHASYTNLDGAAAAAKLFALCDLLRTYGPVILCDVPDRNDLTGTRRVDCNAILSADWADHADAFVELSTVSALTDATNATYFRPDQVHLTTAGYAAVAGPIRAAVLSAT
jgi:lysophospholipase L1-like esterase